MRIIDEEKGIIQLEGNELPQMRGKGVGSSITDAVTRNTALVKVAKRGKEEEIYVAKLNPIDAEQGIYQCVAGDPLKSYAKNDLAGRYSANSNPYRLAGAFIQELAQEEAGHTIDQAAAIANYGRNKARGLESHHINEIETTTDVVVSLPPDAQLQYMSELFKRGYRVSDDPRNVVGAYGSPKNVPGYRDADGNRMVPIDHPGYSQHANTHAEVRRLCQMYNLPDPRKKEIPGRMAELGSDNQRISMGLALAELGRLAVMRELSKEGSDQYPQKANADRKQVLRAEAEIAKAFLPLSEENQKLQDAYVERQIRRKI